MTEQELRALSGEAVMQASEMFRRLVKGLAKLAKPELASLFEEAEVMLFNAEVMVLMGLEQVTAAADVAPPGTVGG